MANYHNKSIAPSKTITEKLNFVWTLDKKAFEDLDNSVIQSELIRTGSFRSAWYLELKQVYDWYSLSLHMDYTEPEVYGTFECSLENCLGIISDEHVWEQNQWQQLSEGKGLEQKILEWKFWMNRQEMQFKFWSLGDMVKLKFSMDLVASIPVSYPNSLTTNFNLDTIK